MVCGIAVTGTSVRMCAVDANVGDADKKVAAGFIRHGGAVTGGEGRRGKAFCGLRGVGASCKEDGAGKLILEDRGRIRIFIAF